MNRTSVSAAVIFGMILSTQATGAGFDCTKAKTTVEYTVCGDPVLSQLDSDLKRVFDLAMEATYGVLEDGTIKNPVGKSQTNWIRKVRNACKDVECLRNAYRSRISEIKRTADIE